MAVGAHGGEDKPVTHIQFRQLQLLQEELVKGIIHGSAEGAGEEGQLQEKCAGSKGWGLRE